MSEQDKDKNGAAEANLEVASVPTISPRIVKAQRLYISVVESLLAEAFPAGISVKPKHIAELTGWKKRKARRFLKHPEKITLGQIARFLDATGTPRDFTLTWSPVNED